MKSLKQTAVLVLAIVAFFFVFNGWSWYARRFNSDPSRGWVGTAPLGGALLAAATFYVLLGRGRDLTTVGLLEAAERGDQRRDGETCAVIGELHGRGDAALSAPFSGEPCLLYAYDVSRVESTGVGATGGLIRPMPYFGRAMAPCEIRTGHDAVALRAFPRFPDFRRIVEGRPETLARAGAFLESCTFRELSTNVTWDEMAAAADGVIAPLLLTTGGGRCDFRLRALFGSSVVSPSDLSKWELRETTLRPGMKVWATGVWSEDGQGLGSGEGVFSPSLDLRAGDPADLLRTAQDTMRRRTDVLRGLVAAQVALAALVAAF